MKNPIRRSGPIRRSVLGLAVILGGLGASLAIPTPATAMHESVRGFWTRAPYVAWDNQYSDNIQDGAYFWQDRGFTYGYVPPLPGYNHGGTSCATFWDRYINVCTVARSIVEAYAGGPADGLASTSTYASGSILGGYVLIANDLSATDRQKVWRHEMGHMIGLGDIFISGYHNCVMNSDGTTHTLGTTCQHDLDAVANMY